MDNFLPINPFQIPLWTGEKPNETEEEAEARTSATQEAIKTSKEIEAWLLEEKKVMDRRRRAIKILLLGQSLLAANINQKLEL
jgi:guanine nucleotide-binding protein subunit alpha